MTVTVTIEGASKSGKSQLANVIHNALIHASNQHYTVDIVDEGVQGDGQRVLRNVDNSSHTSYVKIIVRQTDAAENDGGGENDDSDDNDNVPDTEDSAEPADATDSSDGESDTPEPTDAVADETEGANATE